MAVYILKVTKLVRDKDVLWYRNADEAQAFADWLKEGGIANQVIKLSSEYIECPMIDGVVFVPDYVD